MPSPEKIKGDYRAAWKACEEPWETFGRVDDLRKRLRSLLRSGWSIGALKAYAFVVWRHKRSNKVTRSAWRWAVAFADPSVPLGGGNILERFKDDPEFFSFVK